MSAPHKLLLLLAHMLLPVAPCATPSSIRATKTILPLIPLLHILRQVLPPLLSLVVLLLLLFVGCGHLGAVGSEFICEVISTVNHAT